MPSVKFTSRPTRIALSCVFLLSVPSALLAAPDIEKTTVDDGNTISILGSGFGEGPSVALHDDFSNAIISGDGVTLAPQIGNWLSESKSSSNNAFVDEKYGNAGLFARGNGSSVLVFGIPDGEGPHGLKTFQEVYFSYTIRDLGDFPGDNGTPTQFSTRSSTKDAWMMLGDKGDNTGWAVSQGDPSGHDLYIPAWTGGGFNIAGNNTRMRPSFWPGELTKNWAFGDWNTMMFHAELNPEDPYGEAEGFFSFLNKNAYHEKVRQGNMMEDQRSEGVPFASWDRIKFFAWMFTGDAEVKRVIDEVYIAIGDNANARVLLTDGESLEKSTRVFHLSPESWTDSKIVVRFPDYLPDSETYYLHVLNADNAASAGYRYNLCRSCPKPPESFSVQ